MFTRRFLQISRMDRIRTEEIWSRTDMECSITKEIGKQNTRMMKSCPKNARSQVAKKYVGMVLFSRMQKTERKIGSRMKNIIGNGIIDRDLREGDWEEKEHQGAKTANSQWESTGKEKNLNVDRFQSLQTLKQTKFKHNSNLVI